jgi:hypothetical protein
MCRHALPTEQLGRSVVVLTHGALSCTMCLLFVSIDRHNDSGWRLLEDAVDSGVGHGHYSDSSLSLQQEIV